MQAKIYLTVRCVLAVTRSLSRKFKALSKEDFGCSSVHVFESTGRDDALKKLEFCDSERGWKFECTGATRLLLQKCRQ